MSIVQAFIDAISTGAVYALAALAIGLVFGVMRLANFANGELITAAGYTLILLWPVWWPLAVVMSIAVSVGLALLMDVAVFRWIRAQPPATLLIASFGLSILLQRIYDGVFGTNVLSAAVAPALSRSLHFGDLRVNLISVVSIVLAVVLLLAIRFFLAKTTMGLQVRAASENFRAARLLGIRAGSVIALTFGISGVLAAAIAFVLTSQSGAVGPTFGVQITLFALIGSTIGSLGRLAGSVAGGFLIGFAVSMFTSFLPAWINDFRIAFVYLLVAIILVLAPNGIFASRTAKERT